MNISNGKGITEYGKGVNIELSGNELATAILTYLTAHDVYISGPITIRANGERCEEATIYVDPSGFVINNGIKYSGR